MGIVDLREEKGFSSEVKFETLNHEGGMKVRVLEIAEKETFENCEGVWIKVLLTSPMWVSNKEWIEKYNKFCINRTSPYFIQKGMKYGLCAYHILFKTSLFRKSVVLAVVFTG